MHNFRLPLILRRNFFAASVVIVLLAACVSARQQPASAPVPGAALTGSGGINAPAQRDKPYLILVSLDGFKAEYLDLWYPAPDVDALLRYLESYQPHGYGQKWQ